MGKSLLQDERECYICKTTVNLHRHHIFFGPNRKRSDREGCWCYLCMEHHTGAKGVHNNIGLDLRLKQLCQEQWEKVNGSTADFVRAYGRNYL